MDMINEIGRWLQEKEVLPTALERLGMADKLAEIVLISLGITVLLGILSCFFGSVSYTHLVSSCSLIPNETGRSTPFKLSFRPDSGFTNKGADTRVRCSDFARERSK